MKKLKESEESFDDDWSTFSEEEADEELKVSTILDKIILELENLLEENEYGSKIFEKRISKAIDLLNDAEENYLDIGD